MPNLVENEESPKKETVAALKAFENYYSLGDGRSLEQLLLLYQSSEQAVPTRYLSVLKTWSSRFGWQARIKARITREAAEERQRLKEEQRKIRRKVLSDYRTKLEKALDGLDPSKATWADVNAATKIWLDQSRIEHNDLPTAKYEFTKMSDAELFAFIMGQVGQLPEEED